MKELLVTKLDRRSFITQATAAGGAFLFGVAAPDRRVPLRAGVAAHEVTCWVLIAPDNSVTIRTARSEMGQGALTGLAMLVAEELECDWSSVRTEFVQPGENVRRNRAWGDLSTSASRSIAFSQQSLREAGAAAREMLISAAADRWDVAPSDCRAENGIITHLPTGRRLPFGTVAAQAAKMEPPSHGCQAEHFGGSAHRRRAELLQRQFHAFRRQELAGSVRIVRATTAAERRTA